MNITLQFGTIEEMDEFFTRLGGSASNTITEATLTSTGTTEVTETVKEVEAHLDRETVEAEAIHLGLKFRSDINTKTLQARVVAKKAEVKENIKLEEVLEDDSTNEEDLAELEELLGKSDEDEDKQEEVVEEVVVESEPEKAVETVEPEEVVEEVVETTELKEVSAKPSRRSRRKTRNAVKWTKS